MKYVNLYFATKLLFPIVLIILGVLVILITICIAKLESLFKKNCYNCKHYALFDTASLGYGCRYKCVKLCRIDKANINYRVHYERCKQFENKYDM